MTSIKHKKVIIFITLISVSISGAFFYFWSHYCPDSGISVPKQVKYGFTVRNKTNKPVKDTKLWTYSPIPETPFQSCDDIQASHPFHTQTDRHGNQILLFPIDLLPPYASRTITVTAQTTHFNSSQKKFSDNVEHYLSQEPFIESDHPDIIKLAARLKRGKKEETAQNIFNWVASNITYSGYIKKSKGALYTLKTGSGDCTEFMYLFIALCRANKLPARGISGYRCQGNCILKPSDHHNWAEVFINGDWVLADCQEKVFDRKTTDYVAMNVVSGPDDSPMKGYQRFKFEGDGISVRMNH